jgi:hypothetical protein
MSAWSKLAVIAVAFGAAVFSAEGAARADATELSYAPAAPLVTYGLGTTINAGNTSHRWTNPTILCPTSQDFHVQHVVVSADVPANSAFDVALATSQKMQTPTGMSAFRHELKFQRTGAGMHTLSLPSGAVYANQITITKKTSYTGNFTVYVSGYCAVPTFFTATVTRT